MDAHRAEVQQLTDLAQIVRSPEPTDDPLTALRPTLAGLLAREDISDLVGGFLNGVLLELLRAGRHADVISWVERLDECSPPDRRGVFAPLAVAARHQRGLAEDRHLLDQQPPEVRQAVEMILRTAGDAAAPAAVRVAEGRRGA